MAVALRSPLHEDEQVLTVNWWLVRLLIGGAVLLAISLTVNLIQALRPPPLPYVFQVDSRGEPVGQVLPVRSVQAIPDAALRGRLADFVHNAFTIDKSSAEEHYLMTHVYAMLPKDSQAYQQLTDWYNRGGGAHVPELTGDKTWVEVHVTRTIKTSNPDEYQIDYQTVAHENNDQSQTVTNWRAILHVIAGRSDDPESIDLFVDNIDFAKDEK